MVDSVPPALERLARAGPSADEEEVARLLPELLEEYRSRLRVPLGPVTVRVDGREPASLLEALADPAARFTNLRLEFPGAEGGGAAWDYLRPLRSLELGSDGGAEAVYQSGGKERSARAMARVLLRERYPPGGGAIGLPEGTTGVPTFPRLAEAIRAEGVAPFQLALLLYFSDERFRYEIDLIGNQVLPDRRAGRLPAARHVHRTSRVSHGLDAYLARGELALSNARALEVLVETHGLTDVEMAHVLGGVRELGRSILDALKSRGLASFDSRLGLYRPRLDAFLPAPERTAPEAPARLAPIPNPALRTSVTELLAAADSRATCPLCGDALPPGPHGLLCARCQGEVGEAPP